MIVLSGITLSCADVAYYGHRQRHPVFTVVRAEAGHAWHYSDEVLFNIVKFGPVFYTPGYSGKMPAYEALLEDRDITAVNSWIASTWPTDILLAQQERTLASEQLQ